MVDTKKRITFDIETYKAAFIVTALKDGQEWQEYVVCPSVQGYPAEIDCSVIRGWLGCLKDGGWTVTYNGKSFDLRVLAWIANCGRQTLSVAEVADAAGKLIAQTTFRRFEVLHRGTLLEVVGIAPWLVCKGKFGAVG